MGRPGSIPVAVFLCVWELCRGTQKRDILQLYSLKIFMGLFNLSSPSRSFCFHFFAPAMSANSQEYKRSGNHRSLYQIKTRFMLPQISRTTRMTKGEVQTNNLQTRYFNCWSRLNALRKTCYSYRKRRISNFEETVCTDRVFPVCSFSN